MSAPGTQGWLPYMPAAYARAHPELGPEHNPWVIDPATYQEGGRTYYQVWTDSLAPGELPRLIAEARESEAG